MVLIKLAWSYSSSYSHLFFTVPAACSLTGQIEGFDEVMVAANSYKIKDWKLFWRGSERMKTQTVACRLN